MDWWHGTWAVFEKDLKLELRSRYAINTLLLFVLASLLLVRFTIGPDVLSEQVQAALLWIVILFSTTVGLGRAFVGEVDRGTVLLLQLNTRPSMVYTGKLFFNFTLTVVLNVVAVGAFLLLLNVHVESAMLFAAILLLGALGLSGATTLIAAIIARTSNQGPLFAVLSFPILVPLLLTVVRATQATIAGTTWPGVAPDVFTLIGYAGTLITASVLLFDYVWND